MSYTPFIMSVYLGGLIEYGENGSEEWRESADVRMVAPSLSSVASDVAVDATTALGKSNGSTND
jgi:hypothetical protein